MEEFVCIAAVSLTYFFYNDIKRKNEQVKMRIGVNRVPRKIQKCLKASIVKEWIKGIKKSFYNHETCCNGPRCEGVFVILYALPSEPIKLVTSISTEHVGTAS